MSADFQGAVVTYRFESAAAQHLRGMRHTGATGLPRDVTSEGYGNACKDDVWPF